MFSRLPRRAAWIPLSGLAAVAADCVRAEGDIWVAGAAAARAAPVPEAVAGLAAGVEPLDEKAPKEVLAIMMRQHAPS